jgi:hypothetical protein
MVDGHISRVLRESEWLSQYSDLGYGLDGVEFELRWGQEIFLFSKTFKPALGPTQPPIQCVSGFCTGVKRPGREADHYFNLVSRLRVNGSTLLLPLCVSVARAGTAVPFELL